MQKVSRSLIEPLEVGPRSIRRVRVGPWIGDGSDYARAHLDAGNGRVEVIWRLEGEGGVVDLTVPPGSVAELILPAGRSYVLTTGSHRWSW